MSSSYNSRPSTGRQPLGDATSRVNNTRSKHPSSSDKLPAIVIYNKSSACEDVNSYNRAGTDSSQEHEALINPPRVNAPNPRLSAISKAVEPNKSNRNSQISTTSTNASDGTRRRKTHIGPWHLGKTLGRGATARVRMAKHAVTGQPAAVKIVQKQNALMSQAGSLASLNRKDAKLKDGEDNRRMPYGIQREVAIMKLIEHPHIMKLYDIWENRTEIYLVLEYVDNGELFDHISRCGLLPEDEAMKYFRQLMSAVGYCHQFNICHRDLKPENILLTTDGSIKIADFGMAALQQSPDHRLVTSCGSPHYAAPEVIKAVPYRGDKVDIWSMGVILYATLSGRLPFDNPSLPRLLAAIQKGNYRMASTIGPDAADLIRRMLQVDPRERITINQIWRHPLLKKYEYIDNYRGGIDPRSLDIHFCERPVTRVSDIDKELLRHLKSLWHQYEEKQLVDLLLSDKPNDQKLFYGLLLKHREHQLENYTPDIGYSNSDYHHVRPLAQIKKLSTRQFTQASYNGAKRQVSRFTVVNNTDERSHARKSSGYATTESAETVKSYDPFKDSRPQGLIPNGAATQANVVVHWNVASRLQEEKQISRAGGSSASSKRPIRQPALIPPRPYASRISLASSTRSRSSNSQARVGLTYKRGVSFSNARYPGARTTSEVEVNDRNRQRSRLMAEVPIEEDVEDSPNVTSQIRSRKEATSVAQPLPHAQNRGGASHMFQEDVRQLSSSLARDCDEAFNRVVEALSMVSSSADDGYDRQYLTPLSSFEWRDTNKDSLFSQMQRLEASKQLAIRASYEHRPLPIPPKRSVSVEEELEEARITAHNRKFTGDGIHSPRYINRMVSHIDRLMQSNQTYQSDAERRTASAPNPTMAGGRNIGASRPSSTVQNYSRKTTFGRTDDYNQYLHHQRSNAGATNRMESAIEPLKTRQELAVVNSDHRQITARAVPIFSSPVKAPAPLNIRKVKSQHQRPIETPMMTGALNESKDSFPTFVPLVPNPYEDTNGRESGYDEDPFRYDGVDVASKKKSNWFTRNAKTGEVKNANVDLEDRIANFSGARASDQKKKGFGLGNLFKKRNLREEDGIALGSFQLFDDNVDSVAEGISYHQSRQADQRENTTRQIEPQQNWLARLFHVKPAKGYMCFNLSRIRARQEVTLLLKDWRQYGIKDIVVNKQRSIVFGKVGDKNYLQLKEVAFACEIMTVIEHGKKGHLSIARLTQESGAASSFHKVVETMLAVFKTRGLLVGDERKRRMMIKTLTSA